MMPLVFKTREGVEVHINPWHICAWWSDPEGKAVIQMHGNAFALAADFAIVNQAIREADQPE